MKRELDHRSAEERFETVFSHLGAMTIAWRRLADVPADDPRPWLYATARNLVRAEARRAAQTTAAYSREPERVAPAPEFRELDPGLGRALRSLSQLDREALLLVAWEDLTPAQAAEALSINPVAFRVRLLRARRRFRASLGGSSDESRPPAPVAQFDEGGAR